MAIDFCKVRPSIELRSGYMQSFILILPPDTQNLGPLPLLIHDSGKVNKVSCLPFPSHFFPFRTVSPLPTIPQML